MDSLLNTLTPLQALGLGAALAIVLITLPAVLLLRLRAGREQFALQTRLAVLEAQAEQQTEQAALLAQESEALTQRLDHRQNELGEARATIARLQAEQTKTVEAMNTRIEELKAAREDFRKDFEALANRIFQEKSDRFSRQSGEALTALLNPMREQLGEFRKQVTEAYGTEARERAVLKLSLIHI